MYVIDGDMLVSVTGDRRRLVGRLGADGQVRYEPGMQSAHRRRVDEWLASGGAEAPDEGRPDAAPSGGEADLSPAPKAEETAPKVAPRPVAPRVERAEDMPPFSRRFGTATPGFMDWVDARGLGADEVAALVRRLERM
jgi:hypothetical protein